MMRTACERPSPHSLTCRGVQARATRITIYEHANPPSAAGFVRSVTLVAPSGATHVVWSGVDMTGCGGALTVRWQRHTLRPSEHSQCAAVSARQAPGDDTRSRSTRRLDSLAPFCNGNSFVLGPARRLVCRVCGDHCYANLSARLGVCRCRPAGWLGGGRAVLWQQAPLGGY